MPRRCLLAALTASLLALVGAGAAAADRHGPAARAASGGQPGSLAGCHPHPAFTVCFNDPTKSDSWDTNRIVHYLRVKIRRAVAGDQIRIGMYEWHLTGIAHDLIKAKQRGADVRIVADQAAYGAKPVQEMIAAGIPVTECVGSCTSAHPPHGSINHTKLFLFDLHGVQTVALTSSNMMGKMETGLYNDLIAIRDPRLYAFFAAYWERLQAKSWLGWDNAARTQAGGHHTRGYVFPRTGSGDLVADILSRIPGCPSSGPHRKIWIAMAFFNDKRTAIQDQLRRLSRAHCDVRAVVGRSAEPFVSSGAVRNSHVRHVTGAGVHLKLMLIDAPYRHSVHRFVFTGSANFTAGGLTKSDNDWVRIENGFVFDQYLRYYRALYGTRATP